MLRYCSKCRENSLVTKVYVRKDGTKGRVEFCINPKAMCGYSRSIPFPEEVVGV